MYAYGNKLSPSVGGGLGGLPTKKMNGSESTAYKEINIGDADTLGNILFGYRLSGTVMPFIAANPILQNKYTKHVGTTKEGITLPAIPQSKIISNGSGVFIYTSGNTVYRSTNMVNWQSYTVTNLSNPCLIYAKGEFVAASPAGYIHTSTDGITWTQKSTFPTVSSGNVSISYNPIADVYALVTGAYGTEVSGGYRSSNLLSWASFSLPVFDWYSSVVCYNGIFLCAVTSGTHSNTIAAKSTDGVNWTSAPLPAPGAYTSLSATSKGFVMSGGDSDKIIISSDGINWVQNNLYSGITGYAGSDYLGKMYAYGNGIHVIMVDTSTTTQFITSVDGINWNAVNLDFSTTGIAKINFIEELNLFIIIDTSNVTNAKKMYIDESGSTLVLNATAGSYIRIQ